MFHISLNLFCLFVLFEIQIFFFIFCFIWHFPHNGSLPPFCHAHCVPCLDSTHPSFPTTPLTTLHFQLHPHCINFLFRYMFIPGAITFLSLLYLSTGRPARVSATRVWGGERVRLGWMHSLAPPTLSLARCHQTYYVCNRSAEKQN